VAAIVAQATATAPDPFVAVLAGLEALPEVEVFDRVAFRVREHEVRLGLPDHLQDDVDALARVRDLSLACAPEVVDLHVIPGNWAVLLTRYRACPGERVVMPGGPLRPEACERLRGELRALAARGLVLPHDRDLTYSLRVSSETGTLLLTDWHVMTDRHGRREAFLAAVERTLARWS
jgi:hypothetical protein